MGSSPTSVRASAAFLAEFRRCAGNDGVMSFASFMELALYHPTLGYYSAPRKRIGYGGGTDFFTASTSSPLFGELVAAACAELLGADPSLYTFVEIGAEAGGVMDGVAHPFRAAKVIRMGDALELGGKCVVFSNELFDAQPFRRYVFRGSRWRELGVTVVDEDLALVELPVAADLPGLPPQAPEGYMIDAAVAAAALARRIVRQPWEGLFVAADYGKSWRELVEACPAGTARAYFRHTQSNDLLARPGEQDLTCHVCWDWLTETLEQEGFTSVQVQSQEAFFIRHAGKFIEAMSAAEATRLSRRKLALFQLLHPSHLGQKFQVLHGRR